MDGRGILGQAVRQWVAILAAWALVVSSLPAANAATAPWSVLGEICSGGDLRDGRAGGEPVTVHHGPHDCCLPLAGASPAIPPSVASLPPAPSRSGAVMAGHSAGPAAMPRPERHPQSPRAPPVA